MSIRCCALLLLLFVVPTFAAETGHSEIVLLGTGAPEPNPDRFGPSTAIVVNGYTYIFDAGEGIGRRLTSAENYGDSVDQRKIKAVFLTHLHSDHTLGMPTILVAIPRRTPLPIYGPAGTEEMVKNILAAYKEDIDIRVNSLQHSNPLNYQADAHDIPGEHVYKDENVTIKSFEVKHGSWKHAFGYRIQAPDRVIVISGDTSPTDAIVQNCNHCDVLIHEVYPDAGFAKIRPESQAYFSSFHTSASQLAAEATKAQPGLLILYHQMFMKQTEEELLNEVRSGYTGKVVSGHDLSIY